MNSNKIIALVITFLIYCSFHLFILNIAILLASLAFHNPIEWWIYISASALMVLHDLLKVSMVGVQNEDSD